MEIIGAKGSKMLFNFKELTSCCKLHPLFVRTASASVLLLAGALLASPSQVRSEEGNIRVADGAPSEPAEVAKDVENSVVKIFSTKRFPDPTRPWTKQPPKDITASGVVIAGHRVLTNAHVVLYATQVQVQTNQGGDKIPASVEAVAPGIDLAVLKLDDESFFGSHPPLACASTIPEIRDPVMAYGFPTGGTGLSITKGIVSRIEFTGYNFPVSGLRIQIDAAINPGNSGGPAVAGDKMIGLAFSHLGGGAQNIGYIIPCEEIDLFLKDIATGPYHGKPALFDNLQTLENSALRSFLKLKSSVEGIVVREPFRDDGSYPLRKWDVIVKIGDVPIDDEGMIGLRKRLRVNFRYLVQKIAKDGKVPLTVVRAGKELPVLVPVSPKYPMLIQNLDGAYPSYFIYGPLVFSPATREFVSAFSSGAESLLPALTLTGNPLATRSGDPPAFDGEELVVVSSPFLPHKLAKGYSSPITQVVNTINGVRIKNLRHLVELLRDTRNEFIVIEFVQKRFGESLVFPRKDMVAATNEILSDNGIRSQGSPDVMAVWGAGPSN